jgi:Leucine-rich repeat (LRR) protein
VINNLTSLDVLDLSGNLLTDKTFEADSPFFAAASNLTVIALNNNR